VKEDRVSRLVAYIGNDPERLRCALHPVRGTLVADNSSVDSWGIGFYQGGEVLLQRRPKAPDAPVDFYAVASELATDVLVGQVHLANPHTVPKNENTPPFRFRSWLFTHHGEIAGFVDQREQILAAIPDFLRRNIRGQTDSEHLFHLFLSHLHAAGKLDDVMISTGDAARALSGALAEIEKMLGRPEKLDVVATNGRILLGARSGMPLHTYKVNGVRDCQACQGPSPHEGPERRARHRPTDHDHLRAVILVDEAPSAPAWEEVPDRHLITVSHQLAVTLQPF
jgi:glutamine amidotransferase